MSFDAGSIVSRMNLDASGYGSALKGSIADAKNFSATTTAVLSDATEKQKKIMASVRGSDQFSEGSLAAMRSFYEKQAAEAQKLRQTNYSRDEQAVRDGMAAQIKAMRESARNTKISEEIQRRLFGDASTAEAIGRQNLKGFAAGMAQEAEHFHQQLRAGSGESDEGYGGWLSSMNAEAGRRSVMGKTMKLLMGGGAIGAIAMGAGMIDSAVSDIERISIAYSKGEMSGREMTAEMLKQIPIAGKLGDALSKVWGMLSGETAAVEAIKKSTAAMDEVTHAMESRRTAVAAIAASSEKVLDELQAKMDRMDLEGFAAKLFEINQSAKGIHEEVSQRQDAALKSPDAMDAKETAAKRKADVTAAEQALRDAKEKATGWRTYVYGQGQITNLEMAVTEAEAALAKANELAILANQQVKAIDDKATSAAAEQATKAEQLRWKQIIAAGKEGALDWIAETIIKPLDTWQAAVDQRRRYIDGTLAGANRELRQLGMSDTDKKVEELQQNGGTPAEQAQLRATLDKVDAKKQELTIEEKLKGLREQAMTDEQRFNEEWKNATPEQRAQAKASQDQIKAQRAADQSKREGEQMMKDMMTPQEKWDARIADLNKKLLAHDIDQKTWDREVKDANKLFDDRSKGHGGGLASFIHAGSAEADKYIAELNLSVHGQDEAKKQTALQERTAKATEMLASARGNQQTVVFDIGGTP